MPNHFHFLIKTTEKTTELIPVKPDSNPGIIRWSNFSWGTRQILTGYAKAINKQENLTGSLFTQNTRAKMVSSEFGQDDYTLYCFYYILQNPLRAGLVRHSAEWEFSAYRDYARLRQGTLCDMEVARSELSLDLTTFDDMMDTPVPDVLVRKLL